MRFKQFYLGMMTSFVLLFVLLSMSSFAANGSISATISDIKVYIDNKLLSITDENGNTIQPIIYNGRTYLPARAISEAINKPVTWEAKSRSIYIGKNDLGKPATYLTDLTPFFTMGDFYSLSTQSATDNLGNTYESSKTLGAKRTNNYQIYNIDGKYSQLKGVYFTRNDYKNTISKIVVRIYGDDQLLWSATQSGGVKPIDFNIDITGYNQLKVEFECAYSVSIHNETIDAVLANLGLYP